MVIGWGTRASGTAPTEVGPGNPPEGVVGKATVKRFVPYPALKGIIIGALLVAPFWAFVIWWVM